MNLNEIADELERIAARGRNSDMEVEHVDADHLLVKALRHIADDDPQGDTIRRICDAWEAGSKHWWWA